MLSVVASGRFKMKIINEELVLYLTRTGTHSDLF